MATWPLAARAQQQPGNPPTVGVLSLASEEGYKNFLAALREGLKQHGLVEGSTLRLVVRYADGKPERLDDLARELVKEGSRIIIANGTTAVSAAQRGAPDLPIVMAGGGDAVEMGFAKSLARPGGKITGMSTLREEVMGKSLELLKEAIPSARAFLGIMQAANPQNKLSRHTFETAAQTLGLRIEVHEIKAVQEIAGEFDWAVEHGIDGVLIIGDPIYQGHLEEVYRMAIEHRLASVALATSWVRYGPLLGYSADSMVIARDSMRYVSDILRGADPATLPIEQPTAIQLSVNMKTARALGITIPQSILQRADEVIE